MMSILKILILIPSAIFSCIDVAHAKIINIRDPPFAASGDGSTDDLPALKRAFVEAKPGDTVMIPEGLYRMVLTGGALAIPERVMIWGQSGKSRCVLSTNGKTSDYREFLLPNNNVTQRAITRRRRGEP